MCLCQCNLLFLLTLGAQKQNTQSLSLLGSPRARRKAANMQVIILAHNPQQTAGMRDGNFRFQQSFRSVFIIRAKLQVIQFVDEVAFLCTTKYLIKNDPYQHTNIFVGIVAPGIQPEFWHASHVHTFIQAWTSR